MLVIVKQREYIENFIKFVSTFLVTEDATVGEIELVEANLNILKDRIQNFKNVKVKALHNKEKIEP
jgi:hypothetical protein